MRNVKLGVLAIAMAMACGEEKPARGLVLVLDSDLTIPDSVNEVGLYVEHVVDGRRTVILAQEAKPLFDPETRRYTLPFTQTFVVQAGVDTKNERIRARFVAYAPDGSVVAMREARSSLPLDGVRQLRLPIRFVNESRVQDAQRTGPVPADIDVALRQIAADSRTDPFGRFRHAECAEDQTLGDDGECTPIDVEPSQLTEGETVTASATCFDTAACFAGQRSARIFPLEPGCKVTLPPRSGSELAVAVPSPRGYPVTLQDDDAGTDGTLLVQPVDMGLYELSGNVLTLNNALCKRLEKDAVTTVLVSAQCQARNLDAPICAEWQNVQSPAPVTGGTFLDGPQELDAGDGSTDGPNDADTLDADADTPDADAGPRGFDRFVNGIPTDAAQGTFAATADGTIWLRLGNGSTGTLHRSAAEIVNGSAGPGIALGPNDASSFLELGVDKSAYLIPPSAGRSSTVLKPGANTLQPVHFGAPCNEPQGTIPSFFTVGTFQGRTIAMYSGPDGNSGTGSFAANDDSACFPDVPTAASEISEGFNFLERGSQFGSHWRLPAVHQRYVLGLNPDVAPAVLATDVSARFFPNTTNSIALQSFIDVGNGVAIVSGRSLGNPYDGIFYRASLQNGAPLIEDNALRSHAGTWTMREIFGGHGTMCARMLDNAGGAGVECAKLQADNSFEWFTIGAGATGSRDVHVYGDADYAYFSQLCYAAASAASVHVVAKPWANVTAAIETELFHDCDVRGF